MANLSENSKLNLTLGKVVSILVFLVGTSFTIGMTYQSIMPDRQLQQKQAEEIQDIKITLAKVTTILENMHDKQDITKRDIQALQERTQVMNAEVQIITSYVKDKKR
jgi:hypothetical protein